MERKKIYSYCIVFLFWCMPAWSLNANQFEVSAAAGENWLTAGNGEEIISSIERDNNIVGRTPRNLIWKVGAGYFLWKENLAPSRNYFNNLLFELNFYRFSANIHGNVLTFGIFNNYIFNAPLTSSRLMFDVKPYLFAEGKIAFYAILGAGLDWNAISYQESLLGSTGVGANSFIELNSHQRTNGAYEAGIGMRAMFTQYMSVTVDYLYAYLGIATPSNLLTVTGVNFISPASFRMQTENVLVGLLWKF